MKHTLVLTLVALLAATPVATFAESDQKEAGKPQEKRVVRVVAPHAADIEADEDFVFIGEDGKAVHMGAFGFRRGGFIGVRLVDLTPDLRVHFGVPESTGVMIGGVSEDGPAAKAGVEVGDIVTAIDGRSVANSGELAGKVREFDEGDTASFEIWRDGKKRSLDVVIAERKRPQVDVGQFLWKTDDDSHEQKIEIFLNKLPESVIQVDQEHWNKALGDVYDRLQSPEFQAKIQAMAKERKVMELRIQELEAKLQQLEEKLSKLAE